MFADITKLASANINQTVIYNISTKTVLRIFVIRNLVKKDIEEIAPILKTMVNVDLVLFVNFNI